MAMSGRLSESKLTWNSGCKQHHSSAGKKKTNILNIKCLLVELENHARIEFEQDPHHHPLICQELVSVVMQKDTCMPSDHSADDIT